MDNGLSFIHNETGWILIKAELAIASEALVAENSGLTWLVSYGLTRFLALTFRQKVCTTLHSGGGWRRYDNRGHGSERERKREREREREGEGGGGGIALGGEGGRDEKAELKI